MVWAVCLTWLKLNWQGQLGVPGFESRTWHTKITKLGVWWIQSQAVLPVLVHSSIPKYIICPRLGAVERPYCLSYKIWGPCKQTTSLDSSLDHRFCRWHRGVVVWAVDLYGSSWIGSANRGFLGSNPTSDKNHKHVKEWWIQTKQSCMCSCIHP